MTSSQDIPELVASLVRRSYLLIILWIIPFSPLAAYLVGMALGLHAGDTLRAVGTILPPVVVSGGVFLPWFTLRALFRGALEPRPTDAPGERLLRMLQLPWKVGLYGVQVPYLYGGVSFTTGVCLGFDRSPWLVLLGTLIGMCFGVLLAFPVCLRVEQWLLPLALEEQQRHPQYHAHGRGFFWPRQSWYLPYVFASTILASVVLAGALVIVNTVRLREGFQQELLARNAYESAQVVEDFSQALLRKLGPQMVGVTLFLLVIPTLSAYMLARRQSRATAAVQQSIEDMARGAATLPRWVSTDEVGDLSAGLYRVLETLKEIPLLLESSAQRLLQASKTLHLSQAEQTESLTQQAAVLHQVQVTSQEIRATSELAAAQADAVLQVALRAEEVSTRGEAALDSSLSGLASVQEFVERIRGQVTRLRKSALLISQITLTVKDLADQSNLLALNAAIEAMRSGEHGRGFNVVAREIRNLSDQSIAATRSIRKVLDELSLAIRDAVSLSDVGARQVESGLFEMRTSSESLREMSRIIRENSTAVRQISNAVQQQNTGITQVFSAVARLTRGMDEAVRRLESAREDTRTLQTVATEVEAVAQRYRIQ